MNKQEIFDQITNQIREKLVKGTLPWRRSWKTGMPMNLLTKRPYSGINFLSLCTNDFSSPYYLTFLQCKNKGGSINKGEHGSVIIYWAMKDISNRDGTNLGGKQYPLLRYSRVFNLSQTTLYNSNGEASVIISCEDLMKCLTIQPVIRNNIRACFYSPNEDYISIPQIQNFESPEEYYSSLFHEIIHWTGHQSRIARSFINKDESGNAAEELVAELGAVYLCGLCGIAPVVIDNQASYIQSWLKLLNNDPLKFVQATSEATKAVEYIIGNNKYENICADRPEAVI